MTLTIIGGASGVGLEATKQALAKGYIVNLLSINMKSLPEHPNLIKIKGSATNKDDVKKAINNSDNVLITIGTKQKKGTTLFSSMAEAVVLAANELHYSNPILVISGVGVGNSYNYIGILMKLIITFLLKDQYADKTIMEKIFEKSNLNWEMVQPTMLTDGISTSAYKIYDSLFKGVKISKISRADVANYMINEAENPKHLKRKVVLTY